MSSSETLKYVSAVLCIVLFTALGHFPFGTTLYLADWLHIIWGNWTDAWWDTSFPWPMYKAFLYAQRQILEINVGAYFFVLGVFQVLIATSVFFTIILVVGHFVTEYRFLSSLLCSLFVVIYPTVYTDSWLTMITFYVPVFFCSLCILLLALYFRTYYALCLYFAVFAGAFSLLMYEVQLGLLATASGILIVAFRKISWILLIPIVLVVGLVTWRILAFGEEGGKYSLLTQTVGEPIVLLGRAFAGLKINLVYGWTSVVEHLFPWLSATSLMILFGVAYVVGLWIFVHLLMREPGRSFRFWRTKFVSFHNPFRGRLVVTYFIALLVGLSLVFAGYFPSMLRFGPTLEGSLTRYNYTSVFGSSLFLTSLIVICSSLLSRPGSLVGFFVVGLAAPLFGLALYASWLVRENALVAWQEERSLYVSLFSKAPDFVDDTTVVLLLRGFADRKSDFWGRLPIGSAWAATSAIQLFYGNRTLSGFVFYPDIAEEPTQFFTANGIANPVSRVEQSNVVRMAFREFTPYSEVVLLEYDNASGSLRLLDELPPELVPHLAGPRGLDTDRVLSSKPQDLSWRRLVTD